MAIDAYHLEPAARSFRDDESLVGRARQMAPWAPKFTDLEIQDPDNGEYRMRTESEFRQESQRNQDSVAANGFSDPVGASAAGTDPQTNRMGFYWEAFGRIDSSKTPDDPAEIAPDADQLAALIMHETVHWVRNIALSTTRSSESPEDHYKEEMLAYSAEFHLAGRLGDAQLQAGAGALGKTYLRQYEQAAAEHLTWGQVKVMHPDWLDAVPKKGPRFADSVGANEPFGDPEPIKVAGQQDFENTMSQADQMRYEASMERAEKKKERDELKAEIRAINEHNKREEKGFKYLKAAVGFACSDPARFVDKVQNGELRGVTVEAATIGYYKNHTHLNGCESEILDYMQYGPRPLHFMELAQMAQDYRAAHPSLLTKLGRGINEFSNAFNDWVAELGSGGGSSESSSSSNVDSSGSPSHYQDHDTQSRADLRGVVADPGRFDSR